ncbi:hypothetical protein [Celeribacter sp. SCSIO 80788]|uniref:hypothetical protein n=1 Tax=Celeribacter sp. SCSIO 80788 TaxID=3117013 RepID=UPI003DA48837
MSQINNVGCISTGGYPVVHHLTNHVSQPIHIAGFSSFYASSDMLIMQFLANNHEIMNSENHDLFAEQRQRRSQIVRLVSAFSQRYRMTEFDA